MNKKLVVGVIILLIAAVVVIGAIAINQRNQLLSKTSNEADIVKTQTEVDNAVSSLGKEEEDFSDFTDCEMSSDPNCGASVSTSHTEVDALLSDIDKAFSETSSADAGFADFTNAEAGGL